MDNRLLCCEMLAHRGKPLTRQLHNLFAKVGSFYPLRENFHLTAEVKATFTEKLGQNPQSYSEASTHRDWEKLNAAAKQWIFK